MIPLLPARHVHIGTANSYIVAFSVVDKFGQTRRLPAPSTVSSFMPQKSYSAFRLGESVSSSKCFASALIQANGQSAWKPLNPVIEDWPLAVCDASSVSPGDLVAVDHVRRRHIGESYYPIYRPTYRWWYLSQQKRSEIILMKMYDSSKPDGGSKYVPMEGR